MAVKCEEIEKNLSKLTFEVSAEDFNKAIDKVFNKNKSKFTVPGFRKGKAPKTVVYRMYGKESFYQDALNDLLPDAYEAALKESGLEPVARPEFDVEDIKEGEPVVYIALITTKPEVKLGEYKGIKTEKIDYNVTDEEVDAAIEQTRRQNARLISVEDRPVAAGDVAVIDFEGFVDGEAFDGGKGEDYELEIGSNTFIPGFEDQLIGANIDDLVDVNVTFPEDYHAEALKGRDALFRVRVNDIKVSELPELDDDFASDVSEFDTFEEYRADVRESLEQKAMDKAEDAMRESVLEQAVKNAEFDIPEKMIESHIDNMINDTAQNLAYQGMTLDVYAQYTGITVDKMREDYRARAEKQVAAGLVVEAIAEKEGIEVSPEELELNLTDMAKKYGMELDELKKAVSEPELENIEKEMQFKKTIEMLVNNAEVE